MNEADLTPDNCRDLVKQFYREELNEPLAMDEINSLRRIVKEKDHQVEELKSQLSRQDALLGEAEKSLDDLSDIVQIKDRFGIDAEPVRAACLLVDRIRSRNHSEGEMGDEYCEWVWRTMPRVQGQSLIRTGYVAGCTGEMEDEYYRDSAPNKCPNCGKPIRIIEDGNRETCPECGGNGEVGFGPEPEDYGRCPNCHGTGKKPEAESDADRCQMILIRVKVKEECRDLFSDVRDHECIAIWRYEDDEHFYVSPIRESYIGNVTRYPKTMAASSPVIWHDSKDGEA